MKFIVTLLLFLALSISSVYSQSDHKEEALNFQKELNESYMDPEDSPLLKEDLKTFRGMISFP